MKYVGYELRKLVGKRYLWIFAALLLCLNCVTAFLFASEAGKKQLPAREMDAFYKSYFNAPEQMDEYFARMSAFEEAQSELMADAMQRGDYSFTPDTWQNKYATEGFRDRDFFEALYSSIRSAGQYAADMQRVIDRAQLNLDELDALGVAADSYAYRYQQKVLRTYEKLRDNVHIDSEYSHG